VRRVLVSKVVNREASLSIERLFEVAASSATVLRTHELVHGLLQRNATRHIEQVYVALKPYLQAVGIDQFTYGHAKPYLFELILSAFPREWLKACFADQGFSVREQLFRPDGGNLVPLNRPSAFWLLALATAAAVTSLDEALNLWSGNQLIDQPVFVGQELASEPDLSPELMKSVEDFCTGSVSPSEAAIGNGESTDQLMHLPRGLAGRWLLQRTSQMARAS
jgi:hypothetical protein